MYTERETVKVSLLGNLKISLEGKSGVIAIEEDEFRSPTLVRLFSYIARYHDRVIPSDEIVLALWTDEDNDNSFSILKNLIYRLRKLLKKLGSEEELILTGKKSYYWNPEIDIEIDVDLFDIAVKEERYEAAASLYKGTFLRRHQDMFWAVSLGISYESSYKTIVEKACEALFAAKEYAKMEEVATDAISHDPLSEDFYSFQIRAMIAQDKMKLALEQYHKAEDIIYESLDLEVTDKLHSLWPLLMEQTQSKEKNIKKVQQELLDDYKQGAFYCEYGTFKKIYQLELRRADRMGISVFMSLMTIGFVVVDKNISPEKQKKLMNSAMENLKEILLKNLRSGDVITRYSKSQYIVLLPTCQYETAKMVMKRIETAYNLNYKRKDMELEYSFDAI